MTDRAALASDINSACRITGDFTLRSGQHATEYFDKYQFESQPALLLRVAQAMAQLVPEGTDLLGGLEMGGIPIATLLSQITGIPVIFVRKEAKTYGTCRLAEGAEVEGKRICLIEDVVTTGGAIKDATLALRERGAVVETVLCAIRRSAPEQTVMGELGLDLRPVLTRDDLDAAESAR